MPDAASINRSLSNTRTELEFLRDSGELTNPQFQSIMAQLPHDGRSSQYTDARFADGGGAFMDPSAIAKASQDPNHPANPNNPRHHEWAKKLAERLGNAALFGAGATMGSDLVNSILK